MSLPIHPETRVGALLEAYPGIEDALIREVPAFAKLRNPILRRTVAKVATLEQAARVGGVSVRDLIRILREATGQTGDALSGDSAIAGAAAPTPAWTAGAKIRETIDANAMLETGIHPLGRVRKVVEGLCAGEAVCVISSFRPEPLIDVFSKSGFAVYSRQTGPGAHETFIARTA